MGVGGARQYGKCLERFWQNHHAGKLPHGFHLTSKLYHSHSPAAEKPRTENASFCLPKQREINPTFQTASGDGVSHGPIVFLKDPLGALRQTVVTGDDTKGIYL